MDALVDLTGGLAERYELKVDTANLYMKLATANAHNAFITCSRKVRVYYIPLFVKLEKEGESKAHYGLQGDWRTESMHTDKHGLVAGHAYTITDVKRVIYRYVLNFAK
jgi:calpain